MEELHERLKILQDRWDYIKTDPESARHLLLMLKNGKGSDGDFDTMVDRIIESRRIVVG